jgi:hypothetical protein
VCVCVCVCEREVGERGCMCECVCEREVGERGRKYVDVYMFVRVC